MGTWSVLVLLTFVGCVFSYSGQFIPKSYYVIDHNGHKSDVVFFRSKRDVELFPLLRMKRGGGGGGSSASSQSSAQASSSSHGGGGGGGGAPLYQGGNGYNPGIIDQGFNFPDPEFFNNFGGGGGGGGNGAYSSSFASSSSSSSSGLGTPGGGQHFGGNNGGGHGGIPTLFSRFGEDTGTGIKVSGAAQGPKGAFSSSSSSIDSDGKITYSVKSGKL